MSGFAEIQTGSSGSPTNVNLAQVAGTATATGTGASNAGTQRVTVSSDSSIIVTATGNDVSVTPTIQNASYISGNNMGGLQTIALGTSVSVLSQVTLASQGGLVTGKVIYLFFANPTGSTFTDKGTFTIATADLSKILDIFTITPTVPTGTTKSFGAASNLALGIPSGGTIYLAIVETVTETPASTTDLVLTLSAF